ncbi:MAG: hypothetical protein ACK8QZ_11940, partial [Anaerolineales bacterium]
MPMDGSDTCQKGTLEFWTYTDPTTRYTSGTQACQQFHYESSNERQFNGRWLVNSEWGPTCMLDFCQFAAAPGESSPRWHCGSHARQGYVIHAQECPTVDGSLAIQATYDSNTSEAAEGRLWCRYCAPGYRHMGGGGCEPEPIPFDPPTPCKTCPCPQDGTDMGNPILPASAEKYQREMDISIDDAHPIVFERVYRNSLSMGSNNTSTGLSSTIFQETAAPLMGTGWSSNLVARLSLRGVFLAGGTEFIPTRAHLNLGNGNYRVFKRDADGIWVPEVS